MDHHLHDHDTKNGSSPLSQLVLIKSPYLQLPHPVTLPYNYTPLPASLDSIPSTDFSQLVASVELSTQKINSLKAENEAHSEKIKTWEDQIREREVREKRRIAPGYLDTDQRLLMPTRVDSPVTRTEGEDTKDLGRVFDNLKV